LEQLPGALIRQPGPAGDRAEVAPSGRAFGDVQVLEVSRKPPTHVHHVQNMLFLATPWCTGAVVTHSKGVSRPRGSPSRLPLLGGNLTVGPTATRTPGR